MTCGRQVFWDLYLRSFLQRQPLSLFSFLVAVPNPLTLSQAQDLLISCLCVTLTGYLIELKKRKD